MTRDQLKRDARKFASNLWKAALAGATAALPVFATQADDRAVFVAFAGPALAWLAYAYNVQVRHVMDPDAGEPPHVAGN